MHEEATKVPEEVITAPVATQPESASKPDNMESIPKIEVSVTEQSPEKAEDIEVVPVREKDSTGDSKDEPSSPILIVEKVDSKPRHGDDFGTNATFAQKDAHKLHAQDTEPDQVILRTPTPEMASVAAEVADSAAALDREQPTPPISDEEAGRIGFRRMSQTPIPEVADTAAEVAESAAIVDKDDLLVSFKYWC